MKHPIVGDYIKALCAQNLLISHSLSKVTLQKEAKCLTYDTRELSSDAIFICKGAHFKEAYLDFALSSGAICYVSEKEYGKPEGILVSDIRKAMPILASLFFDNAPEKLVSIGITGTKGKSTVTYYLRAILDRYMKAINKRSNFTDTSTMPTKAESHTL